VNAIGQHVKNFAIV